MAGEKLAFCMDESKTQEEKPYIRERQTTDDAGPNCHFNMISKTRLLQRCKIDQTADNYIQYIDRTVSFESPTTGKYLAV